MHFIFRRINLIKKKPGNYLWLGLIYNIYVISRSFLKKKKYNSHITSMETLIPLSYIKTNFARPQITQWTRTVSWWRYDSLQKDVAWRNQMLWHNKLSEKKENGVKGEETAIDTVWRKNEIRERKERGIGVWIAENNGEGAKSRLSTHSLCQS